MHNIIDPAAFTPPEFSMEALYLNEFVMRWKLKLQGLEDKTYTIDMPFLAKWRKHRAVVSALYVEYKRGHDVIPKLLEFVDVLVIDWFTELAGIKPHTPLTETRMLALEALQRKLNSIPGDTWEIKY